MSDEKLLCAECFKEKYRPTEEFDWREVKMFPMKCETCQDSPVVFFYPRQGLQRQAYEDGQI